MPPINTPQRSRAAVISRCFHQWCFTHHDQFSDPCFHGKEIQDGRTMNKHTSLLYFALCMLPALSAAEVPPTNTASAPKQGQENLKAGDVLGLAATVGMLGAIAVDATLGEAFVRAYPSKEIAAEGWGDLDGSIKLSCDTYRDVSGNHMVAAASACNIRYMLVARNSAYVSGLVGSCTHP